MRLSLTPVGRVLVKNRDSFTFQSSNWMPSRERQELCCYGAFVTKNFLEREFFWEAFTGITTLFSSLGTVALRVLALVVIPRPKTNSHFRPPRLLNKKWWNYLHKSSNYLQANSNFTFQCNLKRPSNSFSCLTTDSPNSGKSSSAFSWSTQPFLCPLPRFSSKIHLQSSKTLNTLWISSF